MDAILFLAPVIFDPCCLGATVWLRNDFRSIVTAASYRDPDEEVAPAADQQLMGR